MSSRHPVLLRIGLLVVLSLTAVVPLHAKEQPFMTGFIRWRSAEGRFAAWQLSGAQIGADGALRLDPASAARETDPYAPGTYNGRNFYSGGSYLVGEALGPETATSFAFMEAIASWSAETPDGAWIETLIRAKAGGR